MTRGIKIIEFIIGLMLFTLIATIIYVAIDRINQKNQERCYNLPLNKFYADNSCLRYKEVLK